MTFSALFCRIVREWIPPAFPSEDYYQKSLAEFLDSINVPYQREVRLTDADRVDFLVGTTAVELKLKCSGAELVRQLQRYAQSNLVTDILVLSATRNCLLKVPMRLSGKPTLCHCFGRSF